MGLTLLGQTGAVTQVRPKTSETHSPILTTRFFLPFLFFGRMDTCIMLFKWERPVSGFSGGVSLDEPPLPASTLTRDTRWFNVKFTPRAPAGRCGHLRCLLAPPGCRVELGRRWAGLGWSNSTSIDRSRARRTTGIRRTMAQQSSGNRVVAVFAVAHCVM